MREADKIASTRMGMKSIAEISELIRRREVSPVTLTEECLQRIEELNPILNAFITVTAQSALREAEIAENKINAGHWCGPLHGIPIGLKDLIDTAGVRTTAGSAVFENRIPAEDAEVVTRLKAAGAVLIGKQNLHEFAYGGSSLISRFGPVRNPVNQEFIAGGSSGGSAAGVASGMCFAAIGTDTAGSIREPAALCGIVGLKPTHGLVSTRGIIPLSVSLDHAGPITRTVEDTAILLDALTGANGTYRKALHREMNPVTIGVPHNFFFEELDEEVARTVAAAINDLQRLGAVVREIEAPVSTDRTLQAYESYAYHRDKLGKPGLYQAETLRRIKSGEHISDEQYQSALTELWNVRQDITQFFRDIDFLVMPTTPVPAPRISDLMSDPSRLRPAELVLLRNTRPVNVWGLPAISVPCGKIANGLPVGLQIIGRPDAEAEVLRIAHAFEQLRNRQ
jgi:aspartyl-tRNA(Asn)/glutamyl-tRNA(Gln) amidotransferase subunit A